MRRVIPAFALLTLALLALWLPAPAGSLFRRRAWFALFGGAVAAALATGLVQPLGVLWLGALAVAALLFARATPSSLAHTLAGLALLLLTAGLMLHRLPGFANPLVIAGRQFTADALPYRLYLNFDKASAGLLLFALLHPRLARWSEVRAAARGAAPVIAATVAGLLTLSLLLGYVRFAPKFPPETWLFLWANLCLTCVAEDAFFRGLIQRELQRRCATLPQGPHLALGVAAVVFGLAHAAGGPLYVLLSTLAGIGYGLAYRRSGDRLEASIVTHFTVNALHFLLFTYPALQRG